MVEGLCGTPYWAPYLAALPRSVWEFIVAKCVVSLSLAAQYTYHTHTHTRTHTHTHIHTHTAHLSRDFMAVQHARGGAAVFKRPGLHASLADQLVQRFTCARTHNNSFHSNLKSNDDSNDRFTASGLTCARTAIVFIATF
jgi:hypothetical protein